RFLRSDRGATLFWGLDNPQVVDFAIFVIFLSWLIIKLRQFQKQAPVAELANEAASEQNRED
ncbi:MAG TPA: hypothetical protein VIH69_03420, partial [Dehalococcoidia bacterium]